MDTPRYVLVSGCMRSGTTLTTGWLGAAIAPPRVALRESGIPNFAHSTVSVLDFQRWLYLSGIGKTVTLELFRDGKTRQVEVTIAPRPSNVRPK